MVDAGGRIWSSWADKEWGPRDLAQATAGARAAAVLEITAKDRQPLMTAVLPDSDGVLRARWGTDPAPGDRHWAFLKTLRPGHIITGTVTQIADKHVTLADVGGFIVVVNPPGVPGRPVRAPADVVAVGQQVTAKILDIDMVREQVTATLKAS